MAGKLKGFCNKSNHKWTYFKFEVTIPFCEKCGEVRNFKPKSRIKEMLNKLFVLGKQNEKKI